MPNLEIKETASGRSLHVINIVEKIGTVLLREKPMCFAVASSCVAQSCSRCLADITSTPGVSSLKRCVGCKFIHYCSASCQKEDWKDHKYECSSVKQLTARLARQQDGYNHTENDIHTKLNDSIRLMARLLRMRRDEKYASKWSSFCGLLSNREKQSAQVIKNFERQAMLTLEFMAAAQIPEEAALLGSIVLDDLVSHFCRFRTNCYAICNESMNSIATGLYVGQTPMVNHSCLPNCTISFGKGGEFTLVNTKRIITGEELTVSYLPLTLSRDSRRQKLRHQFCFACSCGRCENDELCALEDRRLNGEDQQRLTATEQQICSDIIRVLQPHAIKSFRDLCDLLRLKKLDVCNEKVQEIAARSLKAAIERQLFEEAILLARLCALPFYFLEDLYTKRENSAERASVFKYDPTLGTTLLMSGKLLCACGRASEALVPLKQAVQILRVVYQQSHPYVDEALSLLQQAEAEAAFARMSHSRGVASIASDQQQTQHSSLVLEEIE